MAISHVEPLLLLVVVSLFFFPTLGHEFRNCDPLDQSEVKASDLKISPYPVKYNGPTNFTITAYISKVIPEPDEVKVKFWTVGEAYSETHSLCEVTKCPVAVGPAVFTFSAVFSSDAFGKDYYLLATVNMPNPKKPLKEPMMCILFGIKIDRDPPIYVS